MSTCPPSTSGGGSVGALGDGSDGAVTLDGVATFGFASLAGSTYTLTRDVFATALTVNAGITLRVNGCRVFCQGTITVAATAVITASGAAGAASGAAGAAGNFQTIGGGPAGAVGGTGVGANASGSGISMGGGSGGGGGTGTSGAGGTGASPKTGATFMYKVPSYLLDGVGQYGNQVGMLNGGQPGGSGAGDATNPGGGGGAGGGIVGIIAANVVNNGTITAQGGGGGTPAAGNCGGGGPGGGGLILIYTTGSFTGAGTTNVTAGAVGAGVGTGTAGTAGTAGNVITQVLR